MKMLMSLLQKASAEAFKIEKRSVGDIYHGDRPRENCPQSLCLPMASSLRIFLTNSNGFRLAVNDDEEGLQSQFLPLSVATLHTASGELFEWTTRATSRTCHRTERTEWAYGPSYRAASQAVSDMSQEVLGVAGPLKFQLNQHEVVGDTIFLRAHTGNHIAGVLEWDELVQTVTQNDEPQIVPHHTI